MGGNGTSPIGVDLGLQRGDLAAVAVFDGHRIE